VKNCARKRAHGKLKHTPPLQANLSQWWGML
jgi:hypothetical protein